MEAFYYWLSRELSDMNNQAAFPRDSFCIKSKKCKSMTKTVLVRTSTVAAENYLTSKNEQVTNVIRGLA